MASTKSNFEDIKASYDEVWVKGPYTNFSMFKYLLENVISGDDGQPLGDWDKFFSKRKSSLWSAGLKENAVDPPSQDSMWNEDGVCTTFAIQVANKAAVKEIIYGNQGKRPTHRVGWEITGPSGAVVDSSARKALEFKDRKRIRHTIKDTTWSFKGESLFIKESGRPPIMFEPYPREVQAWRQALQTCLIQLLGKTDMICLFRTVDEKAGPRKNVFFGLITWDFAKHTMSWSTKDHMRGDYRRVIEFVPLESTPSSTDHPIEDVGIIGLFESWIAKFDFRRKQFSPEIRAIHNEVWHAAVKHWGVPTFKTSESLGPDPARADSQAGPVPAAQRPGGAGHQVSLAPPPNRTYAQVLRDATQR